MRVESVATSPPSARIRGISGSPAPDLGVFGCPIAHLAILVSAITLPEPRLGGHRHRDRIEFLRRGPVQERHLSGRPPLGFGLVVGDSERHHHQPSFRGTHDDRPRRQQAGGRQRQVRHGVPADRQQFRGADRRPAVTTPGHAGRDKRPQLSAVRFGACEGSQGAVGARYAPLMHPTTRQVAVLGTLPSHPFVGTGPAAPGALPWAPGERATGKAA